MSSPQNQWPIGEETVHVVPFFGHGYDLSIGVIVGLFLALGVGFYIYKRRKK